MLVSSTAKALPKTFRISVSRAEGACFSFHALRTVYVVTGPGYPLRVGFSMIFMRIDGDIEVGADSAGLAEFLRQRQLEVAPSNDNIHNLTGSDGALAFDGSATDLHLDPLDKEGPIRGGIWHATLADAECDFIYDLCAAGQMLIASPQGSPTMVIPGNTHLPEHLESHVDLDECAWVNSPEELGEALSGNFTQFIAYRDPIAGDFDRA